jgi:hypothetical protein
MPPLEKCFAPSATLGIFVARRPRNTHEIALGIKGIDLQSTMNTAQWTSSKSIYDTTKLGIEEGKRCCYHSLINAYSRQYGGFIIALQSADGFVFAGLLLSLL